MDVWAPRSEENSLMAERAAVSGADKHCGSEMRMPRSRNVVYERRERQTEKQGQNLSWIGKGNGSTVGRYL